MDAHQDIAILSTAIRTAGAASPSELWQNLVNRTDLRREPPPSRSHGPSGPSHAYFLDQDPAVFDARFFNISPQEAVAIDPQQRLLLEVVYEALEAAGITLDMVAATDTAVYAGSYPIPIHRQAS